MNKPFISIITVVYNAQSTLENTIKSVLRQRKELYEYWIIDGGSTDGSLDLIRQYAPELTGWISEPDQGIYDAMNKGINQANGKWLYFLGADDQLSEGIISSIIPHLDPNLAAVYGDVKYDTGHSMHSYIGMRSILENTLHHQSAFYHIDLFESFRYNTSYRVNADYELTLRLYLEKRPTRYVPYTIAMCGSKGVSSTLSSTETNHLRSLYVRNTFLNEILSQMLNIYYIYHRARTAVKNKIFSMLKKVIIKAI